MSDQSPSKPSGYGEWLGHWAIEVDREYAHVENTRNGETFHARVLRFPEGYQVANVWSNGLTSCIDEVPQKVKQKAKQLARKLSD